MDNEINDILVDIRILLKHIENKINNNRIDDLKNIEKEIKDLKNSIISMPISTPLTLKGNPADVITWLETKSIIDKVIDHTTYNDLIDMLVLYMANNYQYIKKFYKTLKQNAMKQENRDKTQFQTSYDFIRYKIKEDKITSYSNKPYYTYLLHLCNNDTIINKNKLIDHIKKSVKNYSNYTEIEIKNLLNNSEKIFLKKEYKKCLDLCNMIKEFGKAHVYDDVNKGIIHFRLNTPDKTKDVFKRFFTGGYWYERYIYIKLIDFFNTNCIRYSALTNPKVILNNSQNSEPYEFDIFFLIEGRFFWVECKTGEINSATIQQIKNHIEIRNSLKIPTDRLIFVFLNDDIDELRKTLQQYDVIVANKNTFLQDIVNIIKRYQLQENSISNNSEINMCNKSKISKSDNNLQDSKIINETKKAVESFLVKTSIKPEPEFRQIVIHQIIQILEQANNISINDLIRKVKNSEVKTNNERLSNNKIVNIIDEIYISGNFLNYSGNSVTDKKITNTKLQLLNNNPKEVENKIILWYIQRISEDCKSVRFLENKQNKQTFEEKIGNISEYKNV